MWGAIRRVLSTIGAAALIAVGLVAVAPSAPAQAIEGSDFDAGYIISDYAFYNGSAMTESQIQAFLDSKVGTCQNSNCLNILRLDTTTRPADRNICTQYTGASNERVSTIIYKVQVACGISAKVILVTLQKEQSLVTDTSPSLSRLDRAMGYGCPDDPNRPGWCSPTFAGPYNQIYKAGWQFKRYSTPDLWPPSGIHPGVENIQYHPVKGCGTKQVTVKNHATAALYNYTPYTPNAAALGNLGGTGDSCSSYGNRNFWHFYNNWFGSPTVFVPEGADTNRLSGSTRYTTSIEISKAAYSGGAPTVYVTSGADYPDGLAASPAAATAGGPLLLTTPATLPAVVKAEIQRLDPSKIVVVGGAGVVSESVYNQLAALAPAIDRVAGGNRYVTARAIAEYAFADGAETAYVASGENFPDALTASAAAGSVGAPVILVRGSHNSLDTETSALLARLGITKVIIAGGTGVVSSGIESSLAAIPNMTVTRLGGANRFITAQLINEHAFQDATVAYIASGWGFPDALSAAAVAGAQAGPLYLTRGICTPTDAIQHIVDLGVETVNMVGGTGVIPASAYSYVTCG